jgi:hydroxyacylglutathione hydrolase
VKVFKDFYVYPWLSYRENNCNAVFVDGSLPLLIDPGHLHLFNHVVEGMARDGQSADKVGMVICTHGHPDHIEAMDSFDPSVLRAIGTKEYEYFLEKGKDSYLMTGSSTPKKPYAILLNEGSLTVGEKSFQVIDTPGHSPGGICLYWEEPGVLISGDTVFYMGVGRTDLFGGDINQLRTSIERLARLDVEYLIPGHGQMVQGRDTIRKNFDAILAEFF